MVRVVARTDSVPGNKQIHALNRLMYHVYFISILIPSTQIGWGGGYPHGAPLLIVVFVIFVFLLFYYTETRENNEYIKSLTVFM